ncbi:MAG: ATP-dependent helicase [Chloroflexi bacterium]|nr:ATP-dependent helicase [Chloroflexota bacterium]
MPGIKHLIVDEYQDLNECDQEFVRRIADAGTSLFIAGDDDQSLYSFRYAFPQGIIDFGSEYANSSSHVLKHCFRCAESILAAASGLISHHSPPDRIPKDLVSAFSDSSPQVQGLVHRWKCSSAQKESSLIAESCAELHQAGFSYNSIKILVTQKLIGKQIRDALAEVNVPGSVLDDDPFILSKYGEFISAAARLAVNPDDYFGYRVMLRHLPRVGIGTATSISTKAISANLNYRAVFTESLPDDVFNRAENRAIQRVVDLISRLSDWGPDSTVSEIAETGKSLLKDTFSDDVAELWGQYAESLEDEVSLSDLISALNSPNSSEVQQSLAALTSTQSEDQDPKQSVQIMTIHSAKGLDADIVFVPALEEEIIPGSSRAANPGHVLESARMLYVAITRANVACVMSFTFRRLINGASVATNGSRFVEALGGTFAWRNGPLSPEECAGIKSQSEDWHSARN